MGASPSFPALYQLTQSELNAIQNLSQQLTAISENLTKLIVTVNQIAATLGVPPSQ